MTVTKFNEELMIYIELISDVRLETMKVTSNEQGMIIYPSDDLESSSTFILPSKFLGFSCPLSMLTT